MGQKLKLLKIEFSNFKNPARPVQALIIKV